MGTIGADCSRVARAMTPGPPPQPHGWVRLELEVSKHFWSGSQGMCPGSLGCGVSVLFSSIFFSTSLNKKKEASLYLPNREASLIKKEYCKFESVPSLPTSDFILELVLTSKGGQANWFPFWGLRQSIAPDNNASIALWVLCLHTRGLAW